MDYKFVGSQPIQITSQNVNLVLGPNIMVSPKLDGVRYNMFIDKSNITTIDRGGKSDSFKHDAKGIKENMVIDVEIIHTPLEQPDWVFVFDIMEYNNNKYYNLPFLDRLNIIMELYNNPNSALRKVADRNKNFTIVPKSFFLKNDIIGNSYEQLCGMFQSHYPQFGGLKFDGIIFMEYSYRYYTKGLAFGQYKWKPKDELTIDLVSGDGGNLVAKDGKVWSRLINPEFGSEKKASEYKIKLTKDNEVEIVEFVRPREKDANSILTLETVYSSLLDYVSLDDILNAFVNLSGKLSGKLEEKDAPSLGFLKKYKLFQFMYLYPTRESEPIEFIMDTKELTKAMVILYNRKYHNTTKSKPDKYAMQLAEMLTNLNIDDPGDSNRIQTENDIYNALSIGNATEKVFYKCKVELYKEYEVGFKREDKSDANQITRSLNLSKKSIDVMHLMKKMNKMYKPKIYREKEYITKRNINGIDKPITEQFLYDYTNSKFKLKSFKQFNKTHLNKTLKFPILDYNVTINVFEEGNKGVIDEELKTKPEKLFNRKLRNLYKLRERTVYRYRLSKYIFLELIIFEEISYDTEGNPSRTLNKAFVDIDLNHEGIIREFGNEVRKESYVMKHNRNVRVLSKPEFDYVGIEDYLKESLNEVLLFLFRNICF